MPQIKENKAQEAKRTVKVVGLAVAKGKKQHLKVDKEYKVTEAKAEILVKNKQAKLAK